MALDPFYDPVLFGHDRTERIVAVSPGRDGDDGSYVEVYTRAEDGTVEVREEREWPFVYVSSREMLSGSQAVPLVRQLDGSGYFRYIAVFENRDTMFKGLRAMKKNRREGAGDYYVVYDPAQRYLMQTGRTMFLGMGYQDIVRLQLDIEAYSPVGFPNPKRGTNEVMIVSFTSNRGLKRVLHTGAADLYTPEERAVDGPYPHVERCEDERALLKRVTETVLEVDPDVIEGHNLFGFDLPYLETRMKRYDMTMSWGRDGSPPDVYEKAKIKFAERDIEYPRYTFHGRHVADTMFMVMAYDVTKRKMPGYGLKPSAKHFGFASAERTYVPGDEIARTWDEDPRRLIDYALDDAVECAAISGHLGGAVFASTQMLPLTYQDVGVSGTGKKIESILVREYLRRKYALPQSDRRNRQDIVGANYAFPVKNGKQTGGSQQEVGGYTDIYYTGRYENLIYADVASLYPSIMLAYDVQPEGDDLRVFQGTLRLLTELRFRTKDAMKELEDDQGRPLLGREDEHSMLDAKQAAFKIIINSFYGGLGFVYALFNDYNEADRVTTVGQRIVKRIRLEIEADGGKVIEIDTDGALAVPPRWVYREDLRAEAAVDEPFGTGEHWFVWDGASVYPTDRDGVPLEEADYVGSNGSGRRTMGDREYVRSLTARMADGIEIDFDGRADVMMSMKRKNYALLEPGSSLEPGSDGVDGRTTPKLKGGSLKNRTIQPFRRAFMREIVDGILGNDARAIHEAYKRWWLRIVSHDWTPQDFAANANIKTTLEEYREKVELGHANGGRHPAAAYELAAARAEATGVPVKQGDRISFYVAYPPGEEDKAVSNVRVYQDAAFAEDWDPEAPNENTSWYLKKLLESAKLFRMFFTPREFKAIFSEMDEVSESGEPFDYDAVEIRNREVKRTPMRVIIAGGRAVDDVWWVERAVAGAKFLREIGGDVYLRGREIAEVVSGKARGADTQGERWARKEGIPVKEFPADWDGLGRGAGFVRNRQMAEYAMEEGAGGLIAIWDGESRGTKNMIEVAEELGLKVHVSLYDPERLPRYRGTEIPQ